MSNHSCQALVIHCIDFRFVDGLHNFLKSDLKLDSYDLIAVPGAGKHFTMMSTPERTSALLEDVGISVRLHDPKEIIIINHTDCGAYGGSAAFDSFEAEVAAHEAALRESKQTIEKHHDGRAVRLALATLAENGVKVRIIE